MIFFLITLSAVLICLISLGNLLKWNKSPQIYLLNEPNTPVMIFYIKIIESFFKTRTASDFIIQVWSLIIEALPGVVGNTVAWFNFQHIEIRCVARRRPRSLGFNILWASTWEAPTLLIANNKGAEQPRHLRSLISAFVICYLKIKVTRSDIF